mmetsp:Transcript_24858/g.59889  ORF Transcript_24858/g.59889 Transcript_24858/m.59889 type:complete len:411 (-) Transcript_24858:495-1727(-)
MCWLLPTSYNARSKFNYPSTTSARQALAESLASHLPSTLSGLIPTPCTSRPFGVTYLALVTATPVPFSKGWTFCILPFPNVFVVPTTTARLLSCSAAANISDALAVRLSTNRYRGMDVSAPMPSASYALKYPDLPTSAMMWARAGRKSFAASTPAGMYPPTLPRMSIAMASTLPSSSSPEIVRSPSTIWPTVSVLKDGTLSRPTFFPPVDTYVEASIGFGLILALVRVMRSVDCFAALLAPLPLSSIAVRRKSTSTFPPASPLHFAATTSADAPSMLSPSTLSIASPALTPAAAAGPPDVVAITTTFLVRGSSNSCTPIPAAPPPELPPVAYAVSASYFSLDRNLVYGSSSAPSIVFIAPSTISSSSGPVSATAVIASPSAARQPSSPSPLYVRSKYCAETANHASATTR